MGSPVNVPLPFLLLPTTLSSVAAAWEPRAQQSHAFQTSAHESPPSYKPKTGTYLCSALPPPCSDYAGVRPHHRREEGGK